jgi:hypothetical protein
MNRSHGMDRILNRRSNRKPVLNSLIVFLGLCLFSLSASAFQLPNKNLTPGVLCTANDPDFDKYDYTEQIARCARNVSHDEKLEIAASYGNIPESQWPEYEFDHLIPLCAGGSNDIGNIWPQPLAEAHKKDVVEDRVCRSLRAGTMTQAEAVAELHTWFEQALMEQRSDVAYNGHRIQRRVQPSKSHVCL